MKRLRNERGGVLPMAVVLLFVLTVFGGAYVQFVSYDSGALEGHYRDARIFWAAEEALSKGVALIQKTPRGELPVTLARDTGVYRSWVRGSRMADSKFARWQVTAFVAEATAPSIPLCSLTVVLRGGNVTKYPWFEDHSGDRFYATGDTVDGPVHTNTSFGIAGSPVFMDSVFEMGDMSGFKTHPDYAASPILLKAKPTQGDIYSLSHMADRIRQVGAGDQLKVEPDQVAEIVFNGRTMEISVKSRFDDGGEPRVDIRPLPKSGGFYVHGDAHLRGVLDQSLTLGASGNLVITDDLVYAGSDPVTGKPKSNSGVYLALIAEKNVQVKQKQEREEAGRGIRINAAIVAMDSAFEVVNLRAHPWDMGVMRLWGSVAQYARGQIGAVKANDTFRGYHKSWHFDRRLPDAEIPYLPPLVNQKGMTSLMPVRWGPFRWMERHAI